MARVAHPRRNRRRSRGRADVAPARTLRSNGGFSMVDLIVAMSIAGFVIAAGFAFYAGTLRSARGTASIAGLQRDASFGMEIMTRGIRDGSSVAIVQDARPGGDSLNVHQRVGAVDSLMMSYSLNGQRQLVDLAGTVLVGDVDSLRFSDLNGTFVSVELYLRDGMGSELRTTDDQRLLMVGSALCRNE